MEVKAYLSERVQDQITWLGAKASSNQKKYKLLRGISLVSAVLIPLVSATGKQFQLDLSLAAGVLGAIVAVCQGLSALNKYHENWTLYRATSEALKREMLFFETKTAPYDGKEPESNFHLFVKSVEMILSSEHEKWLSYRQQADKANK